MAVDTMQAKVFCYQKSQENNDRESYSDFELRVNNFLMNIEVKSIRSYVSENVVLITVCW